MRFRSHYRAKILWMPSRVDMMLVGAMLKGGLDDEGYLDNALRLNMPSGLNSHLCQHRC